MKNAHHQYLWFFLLLTFLHACQKDAPRSTRIKGRVTEFGTGKPIAGARIYLLCDQSKFFGSSGFSLTDSLVADADGRFDRTYAEDELCGSVYLLPCKKGYFKGNEIDLTTDFRELDIVLDPEAWLKVITVPDGLKKYEHIGIGGNFRFEAFASEGIQTTYFTARGNKEIRIGWGPFSNPSIHFSEYIFIPGHDTTTYTIHY